MGPNVNGEISGINRQDASFNWELSLESSHPKPYHMTLAIEHPSSINYNSGIGLLCSWWPWARSFNSFLQFALSALMGGNFQSFQNLFAILPHKNKYFPIHWFSHTLLWLSTLLRQTQWKEQMWEINVFSSVQKYTKVKIGTESQIPRTPMWRF